jgi:hypothetical protein
LNFYMFSCEGRGDISSIMSRVSAAKEGHLWYRPESDKINWYHLAPIMITCLASTCAFIKVKIYCKNNHCPNATIIINWLNRRNLTKRNLAGSGWTWLADQIIKTCEVLLTNIEDSHANWQSIY